MESADRCECKLLACQEDQGADARRDLGAVSRPVSEYLVNVGLAAIACIPPGRLRWWIASDSQVELLRHSLLAGKVHWRRR